LVQYDANATRLTLVAFGISRLAISVATLADLCAIGILFARRPGMSAPLSEGRFVGCLLGLAVGDALGAPFEGLTGTLIYDLRGLPEQFLNAPSKEPLYYTDDTEMMIGVAETLVECGEIDETVLMRRFAENYHPERGYGAGLQKILDRIRAGEPWEELATSQFPGGSLGNGAAMRVAPVGLRFATDLDGVWEQAGKSARPTHRHPVGIESAQLLATAVALAVQAEKVERKPFLKRLRALAKTEELRWALDTAVGLRKSDSFSVLGSTLQAHRSVVTAIALFAATGGDFEETVGRAIALGDDTDTLAAMGGALCGALHGIGCIRESWLKRLEKQAKVRARLERLAGRLWERATRSEPTANGAT